MTDRDLAAEAQALEAEPITEPGRRVALIQISREVLHQALEMPDDIEIATGPSGAVTFLIEDRSPSGRYLAVVAPGEQLPLVDATVHQRVLEWSFSNPRPPGPDAAAATR